MSKAGKTTTGWRQRYLVRVWEHGKRINVDLLRGNMKKSSNGMCALIAKDRHGKWAWHVVSDYYNLSTYDAHQRGDMLAHLARLRLSGYHVHGEVPTW